MKTFYVGIKGIIFNNQKGVLLLKRGDFWDIPGGRMDDDEEFLDTLRRELAEELPGIEVQEVGELLGAHRVQKDIDGEISLVLLYFEVKATLPEPVKLSDEHDDYLWVKSKTEIPESLNKEVTSILQELLG